MPALPQLLKEILGEWTGVDRYGLAKRRADYPGFVTSALFAALEAPAPQAQSADTGGDHRHCTAKNRCYLVDRLACHVPASKIRIAFARPG
jgi:hypothetical protein